MKQSIRRTCLQLAQLALVVPFALTACGDSPSVSSDVGDASDTDLGGDANDADDADVGDDVSEDVSGDAPDDPADDASDDPVADTDDTSMPDGGGGDVPIDSGGEDVAEDDVSADAPGDEPDAPAEVVVSDLLLLDNPVNVLSFFLEWRTGAAAPSVLDVDCDEGAFTYELRSVRPTTRHRAFAMGFWPGAECTFTVANGTSGERTVSVTVEDVPAFLPEPTLLATSDHAQPGWTLFNLNNRFDPVPAKVAMVDEQGRYRWYYSLPTTRAGSDTDVTPVSEGVLIGGWGPGTSPLMVDWTGETVWTADIRNHHDIDYDEETRSFWYLSNWDTCEVEGVMPASSFRRWDRDEARDTFAWSICEEWEPPARSDDWAHMNALDMHPDRERVLFSARNQNALFLVRVAPEAALEWVLGGVQSDFTMVTREGIDPVFWHQHSAEWLPGGNIILFDNGLAGRREHSRALELAFDEETDEAWAVWEYRPDPDIFAPVWSDADRQPNGNTLVLFGLNSSIEETHLIEVDADGETVWYLRFPPKWGLYRAERVVDPPLGFIIDG